MTTPNDGMMSVQYDYEDNYNDEEPPSLYRIFMFH
jgi:hypothetical protein